MSTPSPFEQNPASLAEYVCGAAFRVFRGATELGSVVGRPPASLFQLRPPSVDLKTPPSVLPTMTCADEAAGAPLLMVIPAQSLHRKCS